MQLILTASRSEVKTLLNVKGFNLEQCSQIYRTAAINRTQLCAGGVEDIDSCGSDSGDFY